MKNAMKIMAVGVVLALTSGAVYAAEKPAKKKHQTKLDLYLSAKEVPEFIEKNKDKVVFIDVRTPAEIEYVGHTNMMDKNVPLHFKDFSKWNEKKKRYADEPFNDNFEKDVEEVVKKKGLTKEDAKVILMCRSGSRSAYATNLLADQGFKQVYTVIDGFEGGKDKKTGHRTKNGWKNAGNPWTYKNIKEKMYFEKK